ncbi:hypothetical protein IE339_04300 [Priestia koreensis]|nr:hypothetical protein IE339_04300 [Priestia koreensis]
MTSREHTEQAPFQKGAYFKKKSKERSKIQGKNSELKHRHGYDVVIGYRWHGNASGKGHFHRQPKKNVKANEGKLGKKNE